MTGKCDCHFIAIKRLLWLTLSALFSNRDSEKNIEEILAAKGEEVKRVALDEVIDVPEVGQLIADARKPQNES